MISEEIQSRKYSVTADNVFLAFNCVRGNLYIPIQLYEYFHAAIRNVHEQMWCRREKRFVLQINYIY